MRNDPVLKSLTVETKDGEWGKDSAFDSSIQMAVIRGTDFDDVRVGDLSSVPIRHIPEHIARRKVLQPCDLLIETAGGTKGKPTGRTLLIKSSLLNKFELPVTCASFARFIRIDQNKVDPAYLFWLLQHLYRCGVLAKYNTQHTGVARFQFTTFSEREPLPLPSRTRQEKVASILSAYDDMIENNTRRITILEEMAQMIYREWFVNFRFPGHKRVKLLKSELGLLPEGWTVARFGDVAHVTDYVANGSFASLKANVQYRKQADFAILVRTKDYNSNWAGPFVYVDESSYKFLKKSALKPGDIVISNVGDVGTVFSVPKLGKAMTLGPNAVLVRNENARSYLFHYLKNDRGQQMIRGITSGSAQQKFNKTELRNSQIVLPPDNLLKLSNTTLYPLQELGELLRRKSYTLRQTRDLLIPKLISGEINLDNLASHTVNYVS